MFPSIHGSGGGGGQYSAPQMYEDPMQQNMRQDPNIFTMSPNPMMDYFAQPYSAPVDRYQEELDWYYANNRDKIFAKWNQHYTGGEPPLSSMGKMSMPKLPQIKLPAVDWENFSKDAEQVIKRKNKFMKNLNAKVQIMDNLLEQNDDWLVERYYDLKTRYRKANIRPKDFKLNKALTDYKKFQNRYYGV